MRTLLYPFCIAMLACTQANGQIPDWAWADRAGGSGTEKPFAITTDADGNVFVTGSFNSSSITFGGTTLTNTAYDDIFLVKYDGGGSVLWARAVTGPGSDRGMGVATDTDGNVIIVGSFTSPTLDFDDTTITNAGGYDGFIAKYDPDGNALWARSFGGDLLENFYGVAADVDGNVYATGDFTSSNITFGGGPLVHNLYTDAMLLKYAADGNEVRGRAITGDHGDSGNGVATDSAGNAFVCGAFYSSVLDLGGGTLNNAGSADGFLAKYSDDGTFQWARAVSGPGSEYAAGVAMDAPGNVAITGAYSSDELTIGSTTLSNPTGFELTFIAKYGNDGDALWALTGADGNNEGRSIAADPNNDFVVAGYWYDELLSFGGIHFDPGDFVMDIYVVKCSADGEFLWATTAGSDGQDKPEGVSTDDEGSVFVTGWFSGTDITFGSTTLVNDPGGDDLFLAKLNGSVGIAEDATTHALAFYPDPANDRLTVQLPLTAGPAKLTIHDLQGRAITSATFGTGGNRTLDVSGLRPGIYEAVVTTAAAVRVGRFIINR